MQLKADRESDSVTINGYCHRCESGDPVGGCPISPVTGEVVFSVDRMEDPAGNIVDQAQTFTTDEVNTATVKIDATPPKLKTGTVSFYNRGYKQ